MKNNKTIYKDFEFDLSESLKNAFIKKDKKIKVKHIKESQNQKKGPNLTSFDGVIVDLNKGIPNPFYSKKMIFSITITNKKKSKKQKFKFVL